VGKELFVNVIDELWKARPSPSGQHGGVRLECSAHAGILDRSLSPETEDLRANPLCVTLISGRAVELRWLNAWIKVEFFKSALRTPSTNALGRLLLESSASNSIAESTDVFPTEFAPTSSVNCDR